MSDILIRGMEMPESCPCELLGVGYDMYCAFTWGIPARVEEYYECCQNDTKPSWCPLVPVKPHGRLIDADAFCRNMALVGKVDPIGAAGVIAFVDDAPTIIPASE